MIQGHENKRKTPTFHDDVATDRIRDYLGIYMCEQSVFVEHKFSRVNLNQGKVKNTMYCSGPKKIFTRVAAEGDGCKERKLSHHIHFIPTK